MSRPKKSQSCPQRSRYELQHDDDDDDGSNTQLQCHLWARDLQTLLDDDTGCNLFETFLREEKCDMSNLYFVYACNGLRLEDEPSERDRRARVIYRHYVKNGTVRAVSEEIKSAMRERAERREALLDLFDEAVRQVKENIMRTTYVKFIQSDIYIEHVQRMMSGEGVDSSSPTDNDQSEDLDTSTSAAPLPSDSEDDLDDYVPPTAAYSASNNSNSNNNNNNNNNSHNNNSHNSHSCDGDGSSSRNSNNNSNISNNSADNNNDSFFANQMPTVNEDEELKNSTLLPPRMLGSRKSAHDAVPPPRPPQSRMIQLQKRQSQIGLKYIEKIGQPGFRPPPNPYHVKSSFFVPPSAYNSDIQSMSSGNYADLDSQNNDGMRNEHFRRHSNDVDRRKPQMKIVNARDTLNHTVIPRTIFNLDNNGGDLLLDPSRNLAKDNPREFHRMLCEKIKAVLGGLTEDEVHNQSILDNHVDRVFKTPPAQTPRLPSPPLERQLVARAGHKSPYHMNSGFLRSTNNSRRDDIDSAIYTCFSGASTSNGAPMIQPRGRNYLGADSGCDDSILSAPMCNPHENVREWFNRTGHEPSTSKGKNKASVCSGSNRSSKSGQDNKKKSQTSNKEPEVVVGYQYEGEAVPFVIRLPQKHLRLKEFKAHLTKKGNFRYFFKRPMDGFGCEGVYEEVKDDNQVLPLWEGKVFSQIVPLELSTPARTAQEISP